MKKRLVISGILAAMAVSLAACGGMPAEDAGNEVTAEPSDVQVEDEAGDDVDVDFADLEDTAYTTTDETNLEDVEYVHYEFRNQKLLDEHYEKHGIEMNYESADAYEEGACQVINNPEALYKEEAEDGDGVYYLVDTNEFVILSVDGYIRTYFEPSAGKAYFDRQ